MAKKTDSDREGPSPSDVFQLRDGDPQLERHPGAWLIVQGIRYLHAVDEAGMLAYRHVVELLKTREDVPTLFVEALATADEHDIPLRWGLLYLLADLEDPATVDIFLSAAAAALPTRPADGHGCTGVRDGEMLIRTMAIAGLARVPGKAEAIEQGLFALLRKLEERALRIEVVKALLKRNPRNGERIREILPEDDRFMLYLRCADEKELALEVERAEVKEKLARAPRLDRSNLAPSAACHCKVN